MNPAPPKPPINASRKALAAYYSELRRWAQALERWEAALDQRENELAQAMNDYESEMGEDGECGCGEEEAVGGCECPTCVNIRTGLMPAGSHESEAKELMERQQEAVRVGDEIEWLENLWSLPDRRRKKKQ